MGRKTRLWGVGLLVAASLAMAGPASAAPVCVGTEGTIVVCVDPLGGPPLIDDCVYAGEPPCQQVTVPGPAIWCDGRYGPICGFSIG